MGFKWIKWVFFCSMGVVFFVAGWGGKKRSSFPEVGKLLLRFRK